ncbi:MAG: carbon-nitrogen hydrolase family protein [Rhodospirillum sp.]|nr:carbon-nitrogen hydrolase family protein [Rhodospirillum sp.]MCF8490298.1 carbon-nitrogen hydrolase family protein [Rhodospirillum sp.]MCF8499332.1 carbon-nitrogen hydrolase family protein [Rhodospirillum sp.]
MIRVAVARTVVAKDLSANGETIRRTLGNAADQGARLVAFCEGALSGYTESAVSRPEDWSRFDWARQKAELEAIAEACGKRGLWAVVGAAHPIGANRPPHNSLYVFSDGGDLVTRYDKRFLSHTELGGWYTPGTDPVVFSVDGYTFGCAICIEVQFPEVFADYGNRGVDAVLFSSQGLSDSFQTILRAHASLNGLWICAAAPTRGTGHVIGPDGVRISHCSEGAEPALALATLDREDPAYHVALKLARPWRLKAKAGEIYREKRSTHPRSRDRTTL